jgi:hypothetical protein
MKSKAGRIGPEPEPKVPAVGFVGLTYSVGIREGASSPCGRGPGIRRGPSVERLECRSLCPTLPGCQMARTLDLDHGLRFVRGSIEAPCLGDWNAFIGYPVQDHHRHADAADQRLGIELIGE